MYPLSNMASFWVAMLNFRGGNPCCQYSPNILFVQMSPFVMKLILAGQSLYSKILSWENKKNRGHFWNLIKFPKSIQISNHSDFGKKNGEESTSVQREKIIAHQNELPNLPWLPKPPKPACAPPKSFRRKPDNAPMVKPSQDKYRGQAIDLLRWHLLAWRRNSLLAFVLFTFWFILLRFAFGLFEFFFSEVVILAELPARMFTWFWVQTAFFGWHVYIPWCFACRNFEMFPNEFHSKVVNVSAKKRNVFIYEFHKSYQWDMHIWYMYIHNPRMPTA